MSEKSDIRPLTATSSIPKGPFTTICPSCNSHWGGKRTCTIYDMDSMKKICHIPAFPERTRDEALDLAVIVSDILNERLGHKTNVGGFSEC